MFPNIVNPQSNNLRVSFSDATLRVENSHPLASLMAFFPGKDLRGRMFVLQIVTVYLELSAEAQTLKLDF